VKAGCGRMGMNGQEVRSGGVNAMALNARMGQSSSPFVGGRMVLQCWCHVWEGVSSIVGRMEHAGGGGGVVDAKVEVRGSGVSGTASAASNTLDMGGRLLWGRAFNAGPAVGR
jgi:hypothetical protein